MRRILAELVRDEDRAGLLRSLSLLQADDDALGDWAESRIDVTQTALALPALLACPDALWPRVLRAWLRAAGEARPLRGTRIRELRNSLQSGVKPSFQFDTGLGDHVENPRRRVSYADRPARATHVFLHMALDRTVTDQHTRGRHCPHGHPTCLERESTRRVFRSRSDAVSAHRTVAGSPEIA